MEKGADIKAEYARRIREEIKARAARRRMQDFVTLMRSDYLMGWVHAEICSLLDDFIAQVLERKSPRLIICLPPRSGKSELISRLFPAYFLGRNPDGQIIACSYASELSSRFNRDVQRIIDTQEYARVFPDTRLNARGVKVDVNTGGAFIRTSDLFEVVGHAGSYRSAGVGGGITGMGADVLCIDDAVKDRATAASATQRQAIWDWYSSTAYTRLSPGGGVIVMGTRWYIDDLIGRLIANGQTGDGDVFQIVTYPAIAQHDEKHRRAGEALHPERYDLASLEAIRRTIGARDWAALYQQSPVPDGGAVFHLDQFKRWTEATLPAQFEQVIGSWDMTFKDGAASDFVVGQVWGRRGPEFYLLDQVRGQWDFVKTLEVFAALAEKWPKVTRWLVEDKANGSAIISVIKRQQHGITPITPRESKVERAQAVSPLIECGSVYLPAAAPWLAFLEDEILNFPAGAHDDQIDAMTQALNFMREHRALKVHPSNLVRLRVRR